MIGLKKKQIAPSGKLNLLLDRFILIDNKCNQELEYILFPDGEIDIRIQIDHNDSVTVDQIPLHQSIEFLTIKSNSIFIVACFSLFGKEILLNINANINEVFAKIALNVHQKNTLQFDFEGFVHQVEAFLLELIPSSIDSRKLKLFQLIKYNFDEQTVGKVISKSTSGLLKLPFNTIDTSVGTFLLIIELSIITLGLASV